MNTPNRTAPESLAMIIHSMPSGAINRRSKDRDFRSKVIVTESMEVVPKRMDMETMPGKTSLMSKAVRVRISIMSIQAKGKMIPQLMLGGFR